MAPTPGLQPDADDAAASAPAATAAELAAKPNRWARLGDHPIQTALVTVAVGLLFFSLTTLDNKIEKVDTRVHELDDKVDEINLNLTTQINELDLKLSAQFYELNVKLTALIAGLGMTDLVDAAVDGRLPAAEPADAEPAGSPN